MAICSHQGALGTHQEMDWHWMSPDSHQGEPGHCGSQPRHPKTTFGAVTWGAGRYRLYTSDGIDRTLRRVPHANIQSRVGGRTRLAFSDSRLPSQPVAVIDKVISMTTLATPTARTRRRSAADWLQSAAVGVLFTHVLHITNADCPDAATVCRRLASHV